MVMDEAGNVWVSTEDYTLAEIEEAGGIGGGGSGEDESKKSTVQHASGSGKDADEYEKLNMDIDESAEHTLVIDGITLNLRLDLVGSEDSPLPEGYSAAFTSEMTDWEAEKAPQGAFPNDAVPQDADKTSPEGNTLVLTAVEPEDAGSQYQYIWRFTGDVPRKLYNSGVDYLVLRVGDDVVSLPTQGFTGGTTYVQLKMDGVASRMFEYAVTMAYGEEAHAPTLDNTSESMNLTFAVEVQGQRYEMAPDEGEMFYYDVYAGSADMLSVPFGSYNRNLVNEGA